MSTLEQLFCDKYQCDARTFRTRLFYESMPLPGRIVAFLIGGYDADKFQADRDLISNVAWATNMTLVREAVAEFFVHPANRGWLRNVVGVRISTTRLKSVARQFLHQNESYLAKRS